MDKLYLLSILEKYYLNGLIERVKLTIKDNKISINFIHDNKYLTGIIESEFKLNDCELGIYDSTQLIKLVNILNHFILIKQDTKLQKLLIADDEYNLEYPLAILNLIPKPPQINEPSYEIKFKIDSEFITKFLKAYKALKVETLLVETEFDEDGNGKVKFTIGENTNFSNKIIFSVLGEIGIPVGPIIFPIDEVAAILDNNRDLESSECFISDQGLFKFYFENKTKTKSTYILIGKE